MIRPLFTIMNQPFDASNKTSKNRFVRSLFFFAGTITLVLGAIGVVFPILPTTPFLLLSLACYLRSSERMTHWLLNNKYFGSYLRNYKEGKGIPMKTKLFAITVLWITISISAFILVPILAVQIILFVVATAVTVHLVRLPTCRQ